MKRPEALPSTSGGVPIVKTLDPDGLALRLLILYFFFQRDWWRSWQTINYRAVIALKSSAIVGDALPPAVHRLVREWAERHRAELTDNWERARRALECIPGADVE